MNTVSLPGVPTLRASVVGIAFGEKTARLTEVKLLANAWAGSASPYSQVVNIEGTTPYSMVNLQPSVNQLETFRDKDIAFTTENNDGVVTVYAVGDKPENDYTIQATIMEVSV